MQSFSSHSSPYYFAYGSNMNAVRMAERGLQVLGAEPARLPDHALRFNKRAADNPVISYANIVWQPGDVVEGVLYQLSSVDELLKMDVFEGTPHFYSRELFPLCRADGSQQAGWVYIANPAMRQDGLRPARWYLEHLLAGERYLSPAYFARLRKTYCAADCEALF